MRINPLDPNEVATGLTYVGAIFLGVWFGIKAVWATLRFVDGLIR